MIRLYVQKQAEPTVRLPLLLVFTLTKVAIVLFPFQREDGNPLLDAVQLPTHSLFEVPGSVMCSWLLVAIILLSSNADSLISLSGETSHVYDSLKEAIAPIER